LDAISIDITMLKKGGLLELGKVSKGSFAWSDGSKIGFTCTFLEEEKHLELIYSLVNDGEKSSFNYKVYFKECSSNLGKGCYYLFSCNYGMTDTKSLYMAYGSQKFMSRKAYQKRGCTLFYPNQLSSKYEKPNDRYWYLLLNKLPSLKRKIKKKSYKGEPTKLQKRYNRLFKEMQYCEELRWTSEFMPIGVFKALSI